MSKLIAFGLLMILTVLMAHASEGQQGSRDLKRMLEERYRPSRIEINDPTRQGQVTRVGKLLVLAADAVPAKPFHVMQRDPRFPRVHVMDFARVDIGTDSKMTAEPGALTLRQGTRLVVLDVRITGSEVHLLTHTAEPVTAATGKPPLYGCTEFVFHLDGRVAASGDAGPVIHSIERWLEWTPQERWCAPGYDQLCLEP
jgi:hypothetical protein